MTDELREKVARAMADLIFSYEAWESFSPMLKQVWLERADQVAALIRPAVLRDSATRCEEHGKKADKVDDLFDAGVRSGARECAFVLRALADPSRDGGEP